MAESIFIKCVNCGNEFEHNERDQEFYREREFSPPKRCISCRNKKRARFDKNRVDTHKEDKPRYPDEGREIY